MYHYTRYQPLCLNTLFRIFKNSLVKNQGNYWIADFIFFCFWVIKWNLAAAKNKLYNFILQHNHCAPAPMGLPLADQYIRSALPRFVARSKKVTHFDNCKAFFESIYDACNDKVSLELRYTAPKSHEGQKRHLLRPFHSKDLTKISNPSQFEA